MKIWKAGELLITGIPGIKASNKLIDFISQNNLFGVILFSYNFKNHSQLLELTSNLQQAKKKVSDHPLIISIDYEGGFVSRFPEYINPMPAAFAQGLSKKTELTYKLYKFIGNKLRKSGINLNLAPVLDILPDTNDSMIGIRSFGNSKEEVSSFSEQAVSGLHDACILACGKHFPGLGNAINDSHLGEVFDLSDLNTIKKWHLYPYKKIIKKGILTIMSGHVIYPRIDHGMHPSTFNYQLNTIILRKYLKFSGILISDDLGMNAISKHYSLEQSLINSYSSGIDITMACHRHKKHPEIIKIIDKLIKNSEISEKRLFEIYQRQKKLFHFLNNQKKPIKNITLKEFKKISSSISLNSLTSIKGDGLNIKKKSKILLLFGKILAATEVEEKYSFTSSFLKKVQSHFKTVDLQVIDKHLDKQKIILKKYDIIILVTGDILYDKFQISFIKDLTQIKAIDLAICVKNFSDANLLTKYCTNVIQTYGFHEENQDIILDYLI